MKDKKITSLKVAGTYIGTIVGAGFASGQEMLQFFVSFGKMGLLGLLVVTFLFIYFGYIVMKLGLELGASSHLPVVMKIGGSILGTFSDAVITFFLFGSLTAMIAGSGALFAQEFNAHPLAGSLFMAVITIITVLCGFYGIINSISAVVPFLILTAVGVGAASVIAAMTAPQAQVTDMTAAIPKSGLLRNWLWSAVIYTSYNSVTAISILAPLGEKTRDIKVIRKGAILGGLGLGIGALAIYTALYINAGDVINMEVPMIFVARSISPLVKVIYAVVLLAEIYTTAVSDLYGFSARLCNMGGKHSRPVILGSILAAFLASLAGFSNLVKYLYPVVGYCGVITLCCLVYHEYKA